MIYLDNAATTPVRKEVVDAMLPYFTQNFGNPSSVYKIAQLNKKAIDEARETIASHIGAMANEIFFTSGGSEADNWALKGMALAHKDKGNHIITTKVEHHAILHTCEFLEKQGFEVTYLDVDQYGMVNPEDVEKAIKDTTILISIMYANNEIGTINPIKEIGEVAKKHHVPFHTDAVQAMGQVRIDVKEQNIDMLSISGHKINGPKGIGILYIKRGLKIENLIHGGAQERGRRAGTENVPSIVGLAKAVELAYVDFDAKIEKMTKLRDKLINGILTTIPYTKLNGHPTKRLANNSNIGVEYVEGESLLLLLDMNGIAGSSGSACTSGSLDPSHVLLSIGIPHEKAHGSIRFTLGSQNTEEEIDKVLAVMPSIVQRMRDMSPLWEEVKNKKNQ